jgi:Fur family transcriptional regulator, ferric uptake regulator
MSRDTQQKDAIRNAFSGAGRPLSVKELFILARKQVDSIGIATVYRNIRELQKESLISQVDIPGQPPRWELSQEKHHHHFLCEGCDKLFEIQDCPEDIARLLPEGYVLETHDILLRGKCDNCARKRHQASAASKPLH